ncbi:hypothetical protein PG994_010217 [Apiospora phragmitis]|uniref:Pentatricopeptide repeat-containing protein n=1 Tax=Apiospora phragmitis TaxID=2905665 RepID=A0ABR1TPU5_9PEZI
MKATSNSICMLCRHALAIRASRRAVAAPWPSPASYSTTTGAAVPPPVGGGKEASTREPAPNSNPGQNEDGSQDEGRRMFRPVLTQGDNKPSTTVVKETRTRRRLQPKTDSDMNALFQQIIGHVNHNTVASAEAHHPRGLESDLVSGIAHLETMVDSDLPVSEAYHFLREKLYPAIRQEDVNIPQVFFPVASKLMSKVINAKKKDITATDLPPVAEIFRVCVDVGEMDPRLWAMLVERLVERLCAMSPSLADYASIEDYEKHLGARDEMLTDLVESWKVLSLPKHVMVEPSSKQNEITDGFWFPRVEKFGANRLARSYNFVAAFSTLFPQYPKTRLGPRVSILAIATYALLVDRRRSNANVRQGAARFIAKVAYMISTVRLRSHKLEEYLDKSSTAAPATRRYILEQWPSIQASLENDNVNIDPRNPASRSPAANHTKPHSDRRLAIEKRLSRAFGTSHLPERVAALREQQDIFNSFINTYMSLNAPDKAIAVWNTLPRLGMKPTLKTWNVMLDGCKKARNLNGLNTVWSRLQASGLALDIPIWTTRVSGLIDCGDPKGAIEALEELAKRWHVAQKEQTDDALKLAIEPVNAAIAGLVRLGKLKAAQSLLTWSSRQGIRPDVVTFNILLRPLIRDGRDRDVKNLLDTMISLGISADAATFTIVLDGTLANVPLDDIQSQTEVVKSIFAKMEGAGLKSNLHTYGKMIYLLLRSGDRAQESIKLVLSHLWGQGYELSPHIYTMLVEHYFARQPPDLEAVNGLLLRRRLLDYDDMDRVFYDRVIKGFCYVGQLDTALDIHRKLHAAGFMVELDTQYELLHALVRAGGGEHEARLLVEGSMTRFRELHGDGWQAPQHARFWGHAFWHLAVRAGVLTELPVVADNNMAM